MDMVGNRTKMNNIKDQSSEEKFKKKRRKQQKRNIYLPYLVQYIVIERIKKYVVFFSFLLLYIMLYMLYFFL